MSRTDGHSSSTDGQAPLFGLDCKLFHPSGDCLIKCKEKSCKLRHKRPCKNGYRCFFKDRNCEYIHIAETKDTLVNNDNKTEPTNEVILNKLKDFENDNAKLKYDLEKYQNEIELLKTSQDCETALRSQRSTRVTKCEQDQ